VAKKGESVLGLVPISSAGSGNGQLSLAPIGANRAITKDEARAIDEFHKEMLVIDAQAAKTAFGMTKIGQLHQHGADIFDKTTEYILGIKDRPRGREHQLYVEEFSHHQIQLLAKHTMGAIEVGSGAIAVEIARSLYPIPEPPEPRSLWKKLFG